MILLLLACAAPDTTEAFNVVTVETYTDASGGDAVIDAFIEAADGATSDLAVLLPGLVDADLTAAIIAAYEDGLSVAVATDIDSAEDSGIVALQDAGVPVSLGDDAVAYFEFSLNADVAWDSEDVRMTHTAMVVDRSEVLNASSLLPGDGMRWMIHATGQDLSYDWDIEHNQIFGGSDASSLTAYDSLAKSVADNRWLYGTQSDEQLEVWLGPQERLIKRIVDASYGARSNIYVLTDDFLDEGLANALQAKYEDGFDVQVIVGPNFKEANRSLSSTLEDTGVPLSQLPDGLVVPTVVLVDTQIDRRGTWNTAKAMCLSHDVVSAARLNRGATVLTDQLLDGSLWVLDDYDAPGSDSNAQMDALIALWEHAASQAR
ncbi:MAG: hypothetical protein VX899_24570 [Myxococcota bacterium]|nr:hypothetical protein [Myxococcota bacterium]